MNNKYIEILHICSAFELQSKILKLAKIRKLPNGKYRVLSESGKNLGTYDSKSSAEDRLKDVEYFKHRDLNKAIDFSSIDDLSFSAIMRYLRSREDTQLINNFLQKHKSNFDSAVKDKIKDPDKYALQQTIRDLNIDI